MWRAKRAGVDGGSDDGWYETAISWVASIRGSSGLVREPIAGMGEEKGEVEKGANIDPPGMDLWVGSHSG